MSNHTPGPWTHFHSEISDCFYINTEQGTPIADLCAPEVGGVRGAAANARLIAAAPELLNAAKHAVEDIMAVDDERKVIEEISGVVHELRAAIRKATGGEA
jgi:hypothetical protein